MTVNAIAPAALTRMTEDLGMGQASDEDKEAMAPKWIAPIVTWLVSEESAAITGRVFEASGRVLAVAEGWVRGPQVDPTDDPDGDGPARRDDARHRPGQLGHERRTRRAAAVADRTQLDGRSVTCR